MLKTSLSLAVIVLLAYTVQAAPATWYVSKSGNNSNSGTSTNAAFLTIQKAASVMNAGDTCYILSGTYRETVTPAHSGTSSAPITFTAYPGATPIVSGADLLNVSWSVYSNSIYQASTTSSFRQLFVDGVMMNEARWPNATVNNLLYAPRSTPTLVTLTNLTDTKLPSGLNLVGAYMHFFDSEYSNPGFAASTRQITSWNPSNDTFAWSGNVYEADQTGCFYYLYGALSLLDIPTEWYLNTTSQTLYLWTTNSASPATHVVEIKTRTSAFTLDNRSYVTISNIDVFGAGISMANTTSCVVNNCNLEYVQHNTTADYSNGNVPIANLVSGTGSMWENSTIMYSSQDGIRCSGHNEVVSNCVIEQADYYPGTYYACVTAYNGVGGTKIVNNTLWYSGRYCVGSSTPGVEMGYNDMGWGSLLTSDGGAEYVYVGNDDGGGTTIHHNWLHNSWAGLYIDALQNNYTAYRNVCYSNYNGLCFNWFTNNLIINNTSVSNTVDIFCNGTLDTNVSFINNIWHTKQTTFNTNTPVIDDGWYPPLGTNYVPLPGSGAIDGGTVYSPYTDGYVGAAPDIGAYEVGGTYWTPGANFTAQPFPNPYAVPFVTAQLASQSNYIGQTATFTVIAVGPPPLSYQWQAGTTGSGGPYTNLVAGGQFSAVTNSTLTISNLVATNALDYVVVVTNANGSIVSAAATLTVLPAAPSIIVQPASETNVFGQTATFTVTAAGVSPLYYQWQAGAVGSGVYTNLIAGGQFSAVTNAALTIANLTLGNVEDYVVVVTNASGSITSAPATLTVVTNSPYKSMILDDHPVSYWPLNETSGTVIHDVVGPNNGTCMNTNGLTLGGQGVLYGKGFTTDTAIYFTAANSGYINVPYSSTLNTPQFTIEAWLNMPTFPSGITNVNMNPLSLNNASPTSGWAFEIPSPNGSNPKMYGWLAYNAWTQVNSGTCIQSKWAHYALTYNGTTFCIYTNGVLAASSASSYAQVGSGHPLYLGGYNDSGTVDRFYLGGMENVAFYGNALSASHLLSHYQVGSTGIPVAPTMSIQKSGSNAIVSWTLGSLQEATNANGPWTALTNAISPYTVGMTNSALFLRAGY